MLRMLNTQMLKQYKIKTTPIARIYNPIARIYNPCPQTDAGGSELSGGCGWRYNLCIVAAGAAAVLCHAGCDTTALATTAGLGIPACVWACTTLQVAASVQCYDTYCK
jgi:hypothetical protein